jgi:hypothetical protein
VTAPDLSPAERVVVARFGLDRPEGLDLDVIEARANAATPGPWFAAAEDVFRSANDPEYGPVSSLVGGAEANHPEDALFMAHAREDVPALVVEVRGHRDRAARIRGLEREARDEYDTLRADETASVADLVGAEARVAALAAAADIAEGVAI